MSHFSERVKALRRPAIGGFLALFVAIAFDGCILQRISDDILSNERGIREVHNQAEELHRGIRGPGYQQQLAELENQINQLIRSTGNNWEQMQALQTSLAKLEEEVRREDERGAITALRIQIANLQGQFSAIAKSDAQTIEALQQINTITSHIEGQMAKPLPTPPPGPSGQYKGSDLIAGEVLYETYLGVTEVLIVFLGICLLWGVLKVGSSVLRGVWRGLSAGIPAAFNSIKGLWSRLASNTTVPLALFFLLSALLLFSGPALAADQAPAVTIPGSDLPTEVQKELTSTIWQAPLTILAIVLALGGFFGLQGYRDLRDRIANQIRDEVEHTTALSLAFGHLQRALISFKLALDLSRLGQTPLLTQQQQQMAIPPPWWRTFPPTFVGPITPNDPISTHALAHLKAAKASALSALTNISKIPRTIHVVINDQSKEYLGLQARQTYAYYVASDPDSETKEWDDALAYSREAVEKLDDSKWMKKERQTEKQEGPRWIDTFVYVRLMYAIKWEIEADVTTSYGRRHLHEVGRELLDVERRYTLIHGNHIYREIFQRFGS